MCRRKHLFAIFLSVFLSLAVTVGAQQGILEPENEDEARLSRLQPPEKVMDTAGIIPGLTLAEIGAGRGRYVVQLAVRVGETGKVYAEDIDAADLEHLENRCEKWGLNNVETILGDITDPKLPEGVLDLIFVVSSYHHFRDPVTLLRNARPALKGDGRLVIVEWLPWSEKDREGTTPEEMEDQMNAAGYRLLHTETLSEEKPLNIYFFHPDDTKRILDMIGQPGIFMLPDIA